VPQPPARLCGGSIAELYVTDHRNNPVVLERWLSYKTPEIFKSWIRPGNALLVAVEDGGEILAVGCVTDAGEITLNYVSPNARFRGVSTALLAALERRAINRGNEHASSKVLKPRDASTSPERIRKMDLQTANSHDFGRPDVKASDRLNLELDAFC
jgi:GNAT superfamily N-acetyltransferase